jgi:hypothetical protein
VVDVARNGRSESEILTRAGIPVAMGDATYWLRPLTIDGAEQWEGQIQDVLRAMWGKLGSARGGIDGVMGLYRSSVDAELDALYSYDVLGGKPVLPDRVALRMVASRDDIDEALRKLVKHEFPLLKGMDFLGSWVPEKAREIITTHLIQLLPDSPTAPSTNGSSTSTPPTKIRRRSPRR